MIWEALRNKVDEPLATLDQQKPFAIQDIDEKQLAILVAASNKLRTITRSEVEGPYNDLWLGRTLTLRAIRDMHSEANPAYVAALLAMMPNVEYSLNPIKLWMRQ